MPEKVLVVGTSSEKNVRKAVEVIRREVFCSARIDLLCTLGDLRFFEKSGLFGEILVFPPRYRLDYALRLRRRIVHDRYDAVAVLWCLDAGRARPKLFALLCGWRHLLVFNENLDCDYLGPRFLSRLLRARARDGTLFHGGRGRLLLQAFTSGGGWFLRGLLFPIRFSFLLLSVSLLYLGSQLKPRDRHDQKGE